ncbi:CBASS cGAMP synthase [Herbaspirillum huttiense]|uniref:CBASS cGAMP synthase n=1 Tax=Herbaspirillum huttiense TaxID=863372 RepID=UPI003805B57C
MDQENYNFQALFSNETDACLIKRLNIDVACEKALDSAVAKIKSALTPVVMTIAEKAGIQGQYRMPKFRLQGSKVYKTQNAPAHPPKQQVDIDLGIYLAAKFLDTVSQGGGKTLQVPAKDIAKLYFNAVDQELRTLSRREGWKYLDGNSRKSNCCRIDLSPKGHDAHIDVPLYAMPNVEFEKLAKSFASDSAIVVEAKRSDLAPLIDEAGWDELEVVVMATRDGTWEESDVAKVIEHFRGASKRIGHPVMLQRIWRVVKAWRDNKWPDGCAPSSILLMEAVVRIIDKGKSQTSELLSSGRDDRILSYIFSKLADQLGDNVVVNWGNEPEKLNPGKPEERIHWISEANAASQAFNRCFIDANLNQSQVITLMRQVFGSRIPGDISFVKPLKKPGEIKPTLGAALVQVSPQIRVRSTQGA